MVSFRRPSSQTNSARMEPRSVASAFSADRSKVCGPTIEQKTHTSRSGTRAKDAKFQVRQIGSTVRVDACRGLQHIQCAKTLDLPFHSSAVSDRSLQFLEQRNSCGGMNVEMAQPRHKVGPLTCQSPILHKPTLPGQLTSRRRDLRRLHW